MRASFVWRQMWRESRGSWKRFAFFLACLAVGVGAVVSVAGLGAEIRRIIRTEARQLLAADLAMSGRQPPPSEWTLFLEANPSFEKTSIREMVAMAAAPSAEGRPGRSQLVELKVVDGEYPFYGELVLEPDRPLSELLGERTAVVAPDLLQRLDLAPGDEILVGGQPFDIAALVESEPDRMDGMFTLGPRVFLSARGLERTELIRFGSRVLYRELLKLPAGTEPSRIEEIGEEIEALLPTTGSYQVESYIDAQPALRRGLRRVERFLGLVALLSLLIGGVGVAQTVRAWLASRIDAIATLRCIGVRPDEVVLLYLGQTLVLGLVGSGLGVVIGLGVEWMVPRFLADLLPGEVTRLWHGSAVLKGLLLGVGVATLFSLPPLLSTRRIAPVRVFRRDAEPLPARRRVRLLLALVVGLGIWVAAWVQADSMVLGAQFAGTLAVATALLVLAAWLLTRLARRWPRRAAGLWLRHGLGALGRPGAGTMGAIVALGLGVLVVLGITLVEAGLSRELETALPIDAPTAFLVDIQPHQWEEVHDLLEAAASPRIDSVPVISARLAAVAGRPVEDLVDEAGDDRGQRWALTREQRLTYLDSLPDDNEIIAGALWSDPALAEVSLEEEFAADLGVTLGDRLAFDIQGVPVELTVTSLRTVDWETFGINFFLVAEPGTLDEAPQSRLAAVRLPEEREDEVQNALAASFPNVTLFRIREVLDKIRRALERLGLGVRFLGGFTLVSGLVILAGAISVGTVRRGREVAVLKTLGMTRRGVVGVFAVEYGLIGLVAGVIGTAGSCALAWAVLTRVMEVSWVWRPGYLIAGPLLCVLLSVVAGLAVSWRSLERRPVEALRG
jgi:putative ABC transport system permease protein